MSKSTNLNPPLSTPSASVEGRYFLITGGTQGLGLAIAHHLKEMGASGLVLVSRSKDKGKAVVEEMHDSSCQVIHIPTDLSDAKDTESVFPRAEQALGAGSVITGVVNAAAITERGNLFSTTAEGFDRQMAINARAPFLITQGAARHMVKHKVTRGSIVNICSVAAYGGAPFVMAYSAAKAALVTLTKNNAAELAPKGIRVNGINMGWCFTDNENTVQTSQSDEEWIQRADASVPLGRILRPIDVAVTAGFLLSDASAMTTASVIDLHPEYAHGMLSLLDSDAR